MRKVRDCFGGKMGLDSAGFLQDISSLLLGSLGVLERTQNWFFLLNNSNIITSLIYHLFIKRKKRLNC